MWSLVTVKHDCGIQLFHGTVKYSIAIPVNVSLCLLYMWHNYIIVVSLHAKQKHLGCKKAARPIRSSSK